MKNYKLSSIINAILIAFLIFACAYILLSFLTVLKSVKTITASMFAVSIGAFVFIRDYKKNKASFCKSYEQNQYCKFLLKLETMPDNDVIDLLLQIFNRANIKCELQNNHIKTNSANCFFDFSKSTSRKTLCNFLKQSKNTKTVLFCNCLQDDCNEIIQAKQDDLYVIDSNVFFAILKKYDILKTENEQREKFLNLKKLLAFFKKSFTKRKSVTFTLIGISLLFFSWFSLLKTYYLICAFICFCYALICLLFAKNKPKRANESLPLDILQ